jgi:hypothetical protein
MSLYDLVGENTGSSIVVDSSKTYIRALSLYKQRPESVRIILLTRDARGVQYSNIKRGRAGSSALKSWKKYYSRTYRALINHIGKKKWIHIRYEDLVTEPTAMLTKICELAGIDYNQDMLDLLNRERHLTNGNDMRFTNIDDIELDTAWKTRLSATDLQEYKKIAEPLNKKLGYK